MFPCDTPGCDRKADGQTDTEQILLRFCFTQVFPLFARLLAPLTKNDVKTFHVFNANYTRENNQRKGARKTCHFESFNRCRPKIQKKTGLRA